MNHLYFPQNENPDPILINRCDATIDDGSRFYHFPSKIYQAFTFICGMAPAGVKTAIKQRDDQNESLRTQLKTSAQETTALKGRINALTTQVDTERLNQESARALLSSERDQATKAKNVALENANELKKALLSTQTDLLAVKEENGRLKRSMEEQNDEIKTLRTNLLQIQDQNAEIKAKHIQEINTLKMEHYQKMLEAYQRIDSFMDNHKVNNSYSSVSSRVNSEDEENLGEENL